VGRTSAIPIRRPPPPRLLARLPLLLLRLGLGLLLAQRQAGLLGRLRFRGGEGLAAGVLLDLGVEAAEVVQAAADRLAPTSSFPQ
jgi:hypothetical protein